MLKVNPIIIKALLRYLWPLFISNNGISSE